MQEFSGDISIFSTELEQKGSEQHILTYINHFHLHILTIDRKLNFNEHVTNLCDKAIRKIQPLARIFSYMVHSHKQLLMNAYFMSQFGYCPLVWMNHRRTLNNRINGLHKRALSLVYNKSSFSKHLEKDKSVTIHHRNLQALAYEIFKVKTNMTHETAQRYRVEVLKLSYIAEKLYLVWDQK